MNINLNDNLTDEEIDQLVKTRNELTLKIDSHFKKKKIAKINNNKKYIGKCYKDTRAMDHITYMKVIGVILRRRFVMWKMYMKQARRLLQWMQQNCRSRKEKPQKSC